MIKFLNELTCWLLLFQTNTLFSMGWCCCCNDCWEASAASRALEHCFKWARRSARVLQRCRQCWQRLDQEMLLAAMLFIPVDDGPGITTNGDGLMISIRADDDEEGGGGGDGSLVLANFWASWSRKQLFRFRSASTGWLLLFLKINWIPPFSRQRIHFL